MKRAEFLEKLMQALAFMTAEETPQCAGIL